MDSFVDPFSVAAVAMASECLSVRRDIETHPTALIPGAGRTPAALITAERDGYN